jgi:hypothetical protein
MDDISKRDRWEGYIRLNDGTLVTEGDEVMVWASLSSEWRKGVITMIGTSGRIYVRVSPTVSIVVGEFEHLKGLSDSSSSSV